MSASSDAIHRRTNGSGHLWPTDSSQGHAKGPTIRGRALDSCGRPLDQALIEVRDDEGGPVVATGHTDEEGHFVIAVPRAWRFVVTVHPDTPALEAGERPVTLPLGTDLEADVRTLRAVPPAPAVEGGAPSTARK